MKHDGLIVFAVILLALNAGCAVVSPTRFPTPEALQALREDPQLTSSQQRVARAKELYGMEVGFFKDRIADSHGSMDLTVLGSYLKSAGLEKDAEDVKRFDGYSLYGVVSRSALALLGGYATLRGFYDDPAYFLPAVTLIGASAIVMFHGPQLKRKRAAKVLNRYLEEQVR